MKLTLCASSVELLHGVVKTYPDRGEAHLPLESCHQSIVKTPGPLCAHHGGDGAEHPSILHIDATFAFLRLSLNLDKRVTLRDCQQLVWNEMYRLKMCPLKDRASHL